MHGGSSPRRKWRCSKAGNTNNDLSSGGAYPRRTNRFYRKRLDKWNFRFTFADVLPNDGSLAQLVEHDTLNVGVVGSSPTGTTKKAYICTPFLLFVRKPGHLRRSGTVRTYSIKRKNSILGTPNVPISERFFLLRNKPLVKRAKCIRLYSIKIVCYEA